jgi:two-component system, NarL family, response regulator DegU
MPSILVITQTPLLKKGICATLKGVPDWSIQSTSGWGDPEAIPILARQVMPAVTILEDSAGGILDVFEQLGWESVQTLGAKIVVTRGYQDEEALFQLAKWGVTAYVSTRISLESFVETVNRVSHGEWLLDSAGLYTAPVLPEASQQDEDQEQEPVPDGCPLSHRRREILTLLAQGKSKREIALALRISEQTVKNHITVIHKQLGVKKRIPAIIKALSKGWIELPECPAPQGISGSLFAVA